MGIQLRYPTIASPTTTWDPAYQPHFPAREPSTRLQLAVQTGGGTQYVQDKGITNQLFELNFVMTTKAERDLYQALFDAVVGQKNQFQFLDRFGTTHTVRLLSGRDDLFEVAQGRYSGTILLRKES